MNDSQWDAKLKSFLKKTGDDFKRFGNEVKQEAQKLLTEVQDPARQQKLREGLESVGEWARKTADEVVVVVERGVKQASDRVGDFIQQPVDDAKAEPPPPPATPPSPPPEMDEAPAEPAPKKVKKSVGKSTTKKPAAAKKPAAGKKTIGKKKPQG